VYRSGEVGEGETERKKEREYNHNFNLRAKDGLILTICAKEKKREQNSTA
jgi:hypothetical protein